MAPGDVGAMTVARAHRLVRLCGVGIHHYHLVRIVDRETRQHGRFTETRARYLEECCQCGRERRWWSRLWLRET